MKSETAKILFEWVSVKILFAWHHCSCCWCSRELVCSCFIVRVDLLSCTTMYTGSSFFVLWLSPLILVLDSSCRIFCLCWGHHMSLLLWLILVNAVRLVRLSLVLVIVFSCCGSCRWFSCWTVVLCLLPFACAGVFICHYFCGWYPWMPPDLCDCFCLWRSFCFRGVAKSFENENVIPALYL